jgi:hypothetical protein
VEQVIRRLPYLGRRAQVAAERGFRIIPQPHVAPVVAVAADRNIMHKRSMHAYLKQGLPFEQS